jgi:hypothetical protein
MEATMFVHGRGACRGEEEFRMIVPLIDSVAGTAVYINPDYVVSLRPDPEALDRVSIIKLRDGETVRVQGEHTDVADKLARTV